MLSLDAEFSSMQTIPDEIAFDILALVKNPQLYQSQVPAHLLNFFEWHPSRISPRAKDRCSAFLREWGKEYTHPHAQQVIAELEAGSYLSG